MKMFTWPVQEEPYEWLEGLDEKVLCEGFQTELAGFIHDFVYAKRFEVLNYLVRNKPSFYDFSMRGNKPCIVVNTQNIQTLTYGTLAEVLNNQGHYAEELRESYHHLASLRQRYNQERNKIHEKKRKRIVTSEQGLRVYRSALRVGLS